MPNEILTRAIDELCEGSHLTADHASAVLAEIMEGRGSEAQTAAFLIALRAKGETVPELVGLARTMRELAAEVEVDPEGLVDTAGTGGGPTTYNVSTTAALIAAGAGCRVAKHGNRSATSRCGSADLLEALGVKIELTPEQVATCIDEIGFGFMFAPKHHAATKHVVPVRKEIAVRTIFNFLGPLTNPAGAKRQLLGVSDRTYQETIAEALIGLGCERALVVSADDGMDEISINSTTRVIEVADGRTEEWFVEAPETGAAGGPARGGGRRGARRQRPNRGVGPRRRGRPAAGPGPAQRRRRDPGRRRRRRPVGRGGEGARIDRLGRRQGRAGQARVSHRRAGGLRSSAWA